MSKQSSEHEEKRKHKRVKRTLYVLCRLFGTSLNWSSVIVKDISEAGISFITREQFPINAVLELRISTFIRREPLEIRAWVIDSQLDKKGKNSVVRLAIMNIDDIDRGIFKEVIKMFLEQEQAEA